MKKLILLRHAKSDWSGWGRSLDFVSDIERPLSRRGIKACAKISKLFMTMQVSKDKDKVARKIEQWDLQMES